jgi:hypothetical protein
MHRNHVHARGNAYTRKIDSMSDAQMATRSFKRYKTLKRVIGAFCTVLWLLSVATAQTKYSDSEMKEVVRLLIEREVPRLAHGGNVAVLLGPNVKSSWIPKASGFDIRQLDYDEQKRVPEFYDLSSSFKGSVIEVALMKGNYCRKAGRRYEFRRRAGTWQAKAVGYVEGTLIGGRCEGCVVGSGATYSVRGQTTERPASLPRAGNLRLTGSVRKISCAKDADYVRCKVELNLTFTNTGSTSLIILQPHGQYELWQGATSLALSEKESRMNSFVYDFSAWPSVYRFPIYQELANLLDQSAPPAGITRVLEPSASWSWDTSITLSFLEANTCNQHVGVEIGWEGIKRRTAPLWMRVSYEMWPFNVENFKPNLGGTLRKRWQSHGLLYLEEEKAGSHWHAILTSEPIEVPLDHINK